MGSITNTVKKTTEKCYNFCVFFLLEMIQIFLDSSVDGCVDGGNPMDFFSKCIYVFKTPVMPLLMKL